jgi:sorting nexin-1/2
VSDCVLGAATKPATSSGPRSAASRKVPARKVEAQPTKLEAVDNSLDPLGPLGGADAVPIAAATSSAALSDQAPTPPRKELTSRVNRQPGVAAAPDYDDATIPASRTKGPPPVQPQAGPPSVRQTPSSMSVEQAAKPTFDILVGDPHKVGDLTSSHIIYQVRTKVGSEEQNDDI